MKSYQVNSLKVISETLEGETIIINFETGNYYSMNETATLLWKHIEESRTFEQMLSDFNNRYTNTQEQLKLSLHETLKFLLQEDLILESTSGGTDLPSQPAIDQKAFIEPKIDKFKDMQEMLLADPIHDVEEDGWPKLKPDA